MYLAPLACLLDQSITYTSTLVISRAAPGQCASADEKGAHESGDLRLPGGRDVR